MSPLTIAADDNHEPLFGTAGPPAPLPREVNRDGHRTHWLESGGPERDFVWPSPPYFELPGNDTTAAPEHCVIDLLNSAQLRGARHA